MNLLQKNKTENSLKLHCNIHLYYYLRSHRCPKFLPCFRSFVTLFVTLQNFIPNAQCFSITRSELKVFSNKGSLFCFEYTPNSSSFSMLTMLHAGDPGSIPGVGGPLLRLITLKPLGLQQCNLHFWKSQTSLYLDVQVK